MRNFYDMRMRNFYDTYIVGRINYGIINPETFSLALEATTQWRDTLRYMRNVTFVLGALTESTHMKNLWGQYQRSTVMQQVYRVMISWIR